VCYFLEYLKPDGYLSITTFFRSLFDKSNYAYVIVGRLSQRGRELAKSVYSNNGRRTAILYTSKCIYRCDSQKKVPGSFGDFFYAPGNYDVYSRIFSLSTIT